MWHGNVWVRVIVVRWHVLVDGGVELSAHVVWEVAVVIRVITNGWNGGVHASDLLCMLATGTKELNPANFGELNQLIILKQMLQLK